MDKIIITAFTDPMMGLSYESEPIMERLEREYGNRIEFRYVMSLLVRDISDFMRTEVLKKPWKKILNTHITLVFILYLLI